MAIDGVTALTVYRVTQESLANVAKHAPNGRVGVDIRIGGDHTTIEVANSLSGPIAAPRPDGVGIIGMHERVRAIGGDLVAGPTASGWLVSAWFPHAGHRVRNRGRPITPTGDVAR